ncbi:hypothetical protein C8R43DRAFT_205007 [Mycena crocata]|nr:hypothetical protein C8R43DRAFT_205007 [Mycena crocata]
MNTPKSPPPSAAQPSADPYSTPQKRKSSSQHVGSTPRIVKDTSTKDFTNKVLKEARRILADTNPRVLEVPFPDFARVRLPPVRPDVLSKIMTELKNASKTGITPEGGVMHGYTQTTPSQHKGHETSAFKYLGIFISLVIKLALRHDGAEAWIGHEDKQALLESERKNTSRPDSYIHLARDVGEKLGWHHLLMLAEFKKAKKDRLENWIQLLWGCNHVLRNDPRRRFTFGLTAEDDDARVWFFSRACIVVSEPFAYITNPEPLVHFILSIALHPVEQFQPPDPLSTFTTFDSLFLQPTGSSPLSELSSNSDNPAQPHAGGSSPLTEDWPSDDPDDVQPTVGAPSLSHLGFDTSIKRRVVDGEVRYEVMVGEVDYVLERVLCDYKVDELIGRATRIWLVYKHGSPEAKSVVKDVWLESGATHEGDILRELYEMSRAHPDEKIRTQFDAHFLLPTWDETIGEVICGTDVHKNGVYLSLVEDPVLDAHPPKTITRSGSSRKSATGNMVVMPPAAASPRRFVDRQQYRILFPGVLIPLHLLRDAHQQAQVIADLPSALEVLLELGFVHRDLSNTNAMFNPQTQRGVLTDLEYAVKYGQVGQGDVKTGTPFFWSVEVEQNGTYLHMAELDNSIPPSDNDSDSDDIDLPPGDIFFHSILHDLESIWWISLWTALFFVSVSESPEGEDIKADRSALFRSAFSPGDNSGVRRTFLSTDQVRKKAAAECISMPSKLRRHIVHYLLDKFPKLISRAHRSAQQGLIARGQTIPSNHPAFSDALHQASEVLKEYNNRLVSVLSDMAKEVRTIDAVPQDVLVLTTSPDDPSLEKPSQDMDRSGQLAATHDESAEEDQKRGSKRQKEM